MGIILTPFAWLLMCFYDLFQSYGLALILFALVIKLVLFPFSLKGKKSMIQMNLLSTKLQQLQKQYGKDRERYNMEVQKLYEKEKVNPMSGCLWSFVPIIFLMVLYGIIREPLTYLMSVPSDMIETVAEVTGVANTGTYPQIAMLKAITDPAMLEQVKAALGDAGAGLFSMNVEFLGVSLAEIPKLNFWASGLSWGSVGLFLLPLVSVGISTLSMFVSMRTNQMNRGGEQNDQVAKTNRTMMIFMPIMSLWIGFTVPAGLSIYWIAQYIFTIFQELICGKMLKKDYEAARAAAAKREQEEKEEEKRRKEEARLERQRRLEEEKKNRGKKKAKKTEPVEPGINREDSRIGIRAYARGRAYDPDRFGGVQPYRDPSDLIAAREREQAAKSGKKKKDRAGQPEETKAVSAAQEKQPLPEEQAQLKQPEAAETKPAEETTQQAAPAQVPEETVPQAEAPQTAPVETEEVEVEVEQIEEELPDPEDDKKEGV